MTKLTSFRLSLIVALPLAAGACDDYPIGDNVPLPDAALPDAGPRPPDSSAFDGPAGDAALVDGSGVDGTGDAGLTDAGLAALVERGRYLVNNVIGCPECHTPRLPTGALDMTRYLAGESNPAACTFRNPMNNECLFARNLTNHETGLKNRTDAEIKKMFQEGKRPAPTGEEALHPVMPYYVFAHMAPADADAIVAFLRTVAPVENSVPRRGASWDVPAPVPAVNLAAVPTVSPTYPEPQAALRGKYLATQSGLCLECHSPHLRMGPTALDETKLFQGGEDFTGILGPMQTIVSKNLTPDQMTGLGAWTIAEIVKAIKQGTDKSGMGICPPMPTGPMSAYSAMTDQDATDIAHYLKSIAPVVNMVPDMCVFPPM